MRDQIRRRGSLGEEGMSLVEVMIAVFVLSVALLALASTAIASIINLRVSQGRQEATDAASALIEDLRRTDYSLVALDAADPDVIALGACANDEPIVTTSQPGAIPHRQSFGPSGRVMLTTVVSWYDEGDDQICSDSTHDKRVRRVQVVAEWTDGDRTFSLDESTLVAPVDRGLPAPDFRLGTPNTAISFTAADVAADRERCVSHVLRNLGAVDGYEWSAIRIDKVPSGTDGVYYWTEADKFKFRAFFEHPPQDPPLDPAGLNVPKTQVDRHANMPPELELLVDGPDSNTRPETEAQIGTGEQARMWICYRAGTNAGIGYKASFDITVSSQFDPNRTETVLHEVEIVETVIDLHLFDDDESDVGQDGPRAVTRPNGTKYLPILPTGALTVPPAPQPERLGTAPSLPNYDNDLDAMPGTRLVATPAFPSANRIVFHEQVPTTTTFGSTVGFDLWLASNAALAAQQVGDTTTAPQRVAIQLTLEVLDKNENQVKATLFQGVPHTYDSTAPGWTQRQFQIATAGNFTVTDGQYLRLTITCSGLDSTDGCHLAYDHVNHPSFWQLVVRS